MTTTNNNFRNNNFFDYGNYEKLEIIRNDFKNFYLSHENLFNGCLGLIFHATVSNTSIDRNLQDWYQDKIRSNSTDDVSRTFKFFGEGQFWIPFFGITAGTYYVSSQLYEPFEVFGVVGDYSMRVIRSYLVGAPALLFFQSALGCSRPDDKKYNSSWRFFRDDHSFSGHAFMGATPFLVGASMTNRLGIRIILFVCSTLAGLSRINDNKHYFSQVALGWCVSYLSVRAISLTNNAMNRNKTNIKIFPIVEPNYIGLGLVYKR
ncbi:MAG: phosphatase PAP2 family protein [Planctomycetaceae bacterium]|nr:phosphatase PAP2 family protein [Planctomycetaceae bacterium]